MVVGRTCEGRITENMIAEVRSSLWTRSAGMLQRVPHNCGGLLCASFFVSVQMFEAVWGALYKDAGCNINAVYKIYCKLLPF